MDPGACPGPDPGFAGVTLQESFYEIIKLHLFGKFEIRASIFEFMCRRG